MAEQHPTIRPEMAGIWIGDVRGAVIANAFVETILNNNALFFDIRINAAGAISKLRGALSPATAPGVVQLETVPATPNTAEILHGSIRLDAFSPERISGRWELDNGAAGIIKLSRASTSNTTATTTPQLLRPTELVSKESTLPSVTLYRRDLLAIIERLGSLVPPPAMVVVTADVDHRKVVQFSNDFLSRQDLPRYVNEITLNISDLGQPFAKSISVMLSINQSKIVVQSDNVTWTTGAHEDVRNALFRNIGWARAAYQKHGLLINSIIGLAMIIVVPDLTLINRAAFVIVVVVTLFCLLKLHTLTTRTTIYLDDTARGVWVKEIPTAIMGLLAAGAAWAIAKLYDYLSTVPIENFLRKLMR
jgi:hypothetical protein